MNVKAASVGGLFHSAWASTRNRMVCFNHRGLIEFRSGLF
jgi:hypothetical protein